ncbi:MAG: hypothetical protein GF317_16125 [Candidatus Lokiarchaeota archaeon]|nr:hypothetical protein [Candidatus Lokiarchaeota archaeon]MBD3201062.1 hypothetical protein [Candidatus Lokiarchaeota archaeon]
MTEENKEIESEPTTTEKKSSEKPKKAKSTKEDFKEFQKSVSKGLKESGYNDAFDYIALAVGVYGFIWLMIQIIATLITNLSGASGRAGYWIIRFFIYLMVGLFPFFAKLVEKINNKSSVELPLHFVQSISEIRRLILYLGFWSILIFWFVDNLVSFWVHGIMTILMLVVIFQDLFRRDK